jgi:putative hydrolase of the HAD superfamily
MGGSDRSPDPKPRLAAGTSVRAVLFDLGETLLRFGRLSPQTLFNKASRLSYDYLKELGQPVGSYARYWVVNWVGLRWNLLRSWMHKCDFDSLAVLRRHGEKKGFRLTDPQWLGLEEAWYRPLAQQVHVEPDLPQTLKQLADRGLKLGILSNSFIHASAMDEHLRQLGILNFFPVRMYSYEFGFRKPDLRFFHEAARRLGVPPAETIFVGDRIGADVRGSHAAGMIPVLLSAHTNAGKRPPEGVLCIDRLAELPAILDNRNTPA